MAQKKDTQREFEIPLKFVKKGGRYVEKGVVFTGTRHAYTDSYTEQELILIKGVQKCAKGSSELPKFCKTTVTGIDNNGLYAVVVENGHTCLSAPYFDHHFDRAFEHEVLCGKLSEYTKSE